MHTKHLNTLTIYTLFEVAKLSLCNDFSDRSFADDLQIRVCNITNAATVIEADKVFKTRSARQK
jgi:hypothetical protein